MVNTLYLHLEAPLQCWGEQGRWSVRDTSSEPTKSGVIGLIGCAMGVGDGATLSRFSTHTQMAVRIDRPGTRLTDYHTIGGGYDEPALLTAAGKPKNSSGRPHTEISLRDYLCDAAFVVALWSADSVLIQRIAAAVQNPVWTLFLGRKSCPPATPVFFGLAETADVETAIRQAPLTDRVVTNQAGRVRAVVETTPIDGILRRDQLVSRRYRRFAPRYTRDIEISVLKGKKS
ncbi:MAG: type I-E CRISPR-associated protein Cas5/CasD [Anaerolineae bacterium]|nr:type I-E CRISPR-associated protein Cas5/CasD [Anaerolineae bacterium]